MVPVGLAERSGVDPSVAPTVSGDRERARAHLAWAKAKMRALDVDGALAATDAALQEAVRLARPEDHRDLLADVLLQQASLRQLRDKDDASASAALRLATRLEPERTALDPALHAPSLVLAWERARRENAEAPSALVVVAPQVIDADGALLGQASAEPAPEPTKDVPVEVVVDGVVQGIDGGLVSLSTGPHLVSLRARSCSTVTSIVDVVAEGTQVTPVLQPADAFMRRAALTARLHALGETEPTVILSQLALLSGADVVVALGKTPWLWRKDRGARQLASDPGDVTAFALAVEHLLSRQELSSSPSTSLSTSSSNSTSNSSSSVTVATSARSDVDKDADDGFPRWVVGAVVVGVGVAAGAGIAAATLWQGTPPSPPARPVIVTAVVP
jgi:hypothetical protein